MSMPMLSFPALFPKGVFARPRGVIGLFIALSILGCVFGGAALYGEAARRAVLQAPAPSVYVVDRNGVFITQAHFATDRARADYGFWPLETIPDRVARATLALEDRRFYDHPGVDIRAIARALWFSARTFSARTFYARKFYANEGAKHSGASTIAMQIARLQRPAPRQWRAKILEAATALLLCARYSREDLLKHYLRLSPYGNGSHGIAHAARFYFDKPADDLSWAEIALLSAVPQSPTRMNLFDWEGVARAKTRGARALAELARQGVIDPIELEAARRQLRAMGLPHRPRRAHGLHAALRYERLARDHAIAPRSWFDRRIFATLDLSLQNRMELLARRYLDQWREAGAQQAAMMIVSRESGEVLARIGSLDYRSGPGGAYDFTHSLRSPGSTLKPFIYAQAFDLEALRPNDILADSPDGAGGIGNADGQFLGPMSPRQALANSRNVPAALLIKTIGLDAAFRRFRDLKLHDLDTPAEKFGLSVAIGALPVRMDDLARAYLALANDGVMRDLTEARGQPAPPAYRVMRARSARLVLSFLSDPQARLPAFPRYGPTEYPFTVALKTGTSQGWCDAWTAAISARYIVLAWVGRADAGSMRAITGAGGPARLVNAALSHLHGAAPGQIAMEDFPPPEGHELHELCAATGKPNAGDCPQTFMEFLRPQDFVAAAQTPASSPAYARADPSAGANNPPLAHSRAAPIEILSPAADIRLWRNREQPEALNKIALRAKWPPGLEQILWVIDGAPYALAERDQTIYWPLRPGAHRIQARPPLTAGGSKITRVVVE